MYRIEIVRPDKSKMYKNILNYSIRQSTRMIEMTELDGDVIIVPISRLIEEINIIEVKDD